MIEDTDYEFDMMERNQKSEEARGPQWSTQWTEDDVLEVRVFAQGMRSKGNPVSPKAIARYLAEECRGGFDIEDPAGIARIRHILRGTSFKHITHRGIESRATGGSPKALTAAQGAEVAAEYAAGATVAELACRYGVSKSTIHRKIAKAGKKG